MVPIITRETTFGQHVRKVVLGVNKFDLDLGVQIDPVKQTRTRLCGSGHVSHRWTSAFDDHFDHRFSVFKDVPLRMRLVKIVHL